jgi:hypothetical protein
MVIIPATEAMKVMSKEVHTIMIAEYVNAGSCIVQHRCVVTLWMRYLVEEKKLAMEKLADFCVKRILARKVKPST